MRYKLADAHSVQLNSAAFGLVTIDFKAGTISPKSEQEELALRLLVDQGLATVEESKGEGE